MLYNTGKEFNKSQKLYHGKYTKKMTLRKLVI